MLILACLTIGLNSIFLIYTDLGIFGIAIAYAVALTSFNLVKIIFNYHHFKVFPLSWPMLWAVFLCSVSIGIVYFLPNFQHQLVNLIYKPTLVLVFVFVGNHFLKIYPTRQYLDKIIKKK